MKRLLSWHRARQARLHTPIVPKPDYTAEQIALLRQDVRDLERAGDMSILLMEFEGLDKVMAQPRTDNGRPGLIRRFNAWVDRCLDALVEDEGRKSADRAFRGADDITAARMEAQHRHNAEAMKQSGNHMTGPED